MCLYDEWDHSEPLQDFTHERCEYLLVHSGEDWNNLDIVKCNSSLYTLFLACSRLTFHPVIGKHITCMGIEFIHEKIPSHIHTSHSSSSRVVQVQISLPFHEQMVHYRRCGLSKCFIYEAWRKTSSHHVVTLSLAAAQRFCCSPPMIRWVVHPEDVRAFSCGVTAACACLSCGRRWLRVGGGCCQMMAPGGAMCEMKVGGEWGRKK